MADTRCWSREFATEFINIYKENPCLWRVKSKDYTNKVIKNKAYGKLVAFCKRVFPEANRDFVVKKIQSLRGSFRKEMKKCLESKQLSSSTDEVYVSTLWYYDLLLFTKDQELPSDNLSNIEDSQFFSVNLKTEDGQEEDYLDESTTESTQGCTQIEEQQEQRETCARQSDQLATSSLLNKKRKLEPPSQTINVCNNAQTVNVQAEEFDATGINVARKLQRMDPVQALYAESLINTVLKRGLLNKLQDCTDLCDNQCSRHVIPPVPASHFYHGNSK